MMFLVPVLVLNGTLFDVIVKVNQKEANLFGIPLHIDTYPHSGREKKRRTNKKRLPLNTLNSIRFAANRPGRPISASKRQPFLASRPSPGPTQTLYQLQENLCNAQAALVDFLDKTRCFQVSCLSQKTTWQPDAEMAMGQKPVPPVNIPIPTKVDHNGWCTYPKMVPLVLTTTPK